MISIAYSYSLCFLFFFLPLCLLCSLICFSLCTGMSVSGWWAWRTSWLPDTPVPSHPTVVLQPINPGSSVTHRQFASVEPYCYSQSQI